MGMFDSVHTGTRCGQTKAFASTLSDLSPGVGVDGPDGSYAMHEGGWLVVADGVLVGWVDEPVEGTRRYDSGGNRLRGDLPSGYHYTAPTREETAARISRHSSQTGDALAAMIDRSHAERAASAAGLPGDCDVCAELRTAST